MQEAELVQLGADAAVLTMVAIDTGADASLVAEATEGFVAAHRCANANVTRIAFHSFITSTSQQALRLLRFKLVREKRRPPRPPSALQRSVIETRGSAQALATEPRDKAGASRVNLKSFDEFWQCSRLPSHSPQPSVDLTNSRVENLACSRQVVLAIAVVSQRGSGDDGGGTAATAAGKQQQAAAKVVLSTAIATILVSIMTITTMVQSTW